MDRIRQQVVTVVPSHVVFGLANPEQALKRILWTLAEFTSEKHLDQATPSPGFCRHRLARGSCAHDLR